MEDPSYFFCKSFRITPDLQDTKSLVNGEIAVILKVQTGKDIIEFEDLNYALIFNPDGFFVFQREGEHQLFTNSGWGRIEKADLLKAPLIIPIDSGYEILDTNKVKVLREKYFVFEMS